MENSRNHKKPRTEQKHRWSDIMQTEYEELSDIYKFSSTRGSNLDVLTSLGVQDDVERFFSTLGIRNLLTITGPYYPDLARMFFASADYIPSSADVREGRLTFFLNREFYSLTIGELCKIYGFPQNSDPAPKSFPEKRDFWESLASSKHQLFMGVEMIRNPALRIIVELLNQTLFYKRESRDLQVDELAVLYQGVRQLIPDLPGTSRFSINLGSILAERFARWKHSLIWEGRYFTNRHCNLLTPIFEYLDIDLEYEEQDEKDKTIDMKRLRRNGIMSNDGKYCFLNLDGRECQINLPSPAATLTSFRNLQFQLPLED